MMDYIETSAERCSGCSACAAVCPAQAIVMQADSEGFSCPEVDVERCVHCGLCRKTCPALNTQNNSSNIRKAYAVKWVDDPRKDSASGALFPAIAKYILEEKGGWICGCVLEDMLPLHIVSNRWSDVRRMQDSKYVQSDMRNCFSEIAAFLQAGKWVLFSGTSCQVAGLKAFLKAKRQDDGYLVTMDFFCHGVPSPLIWKEYLNFYKQKKGRTPVSFRFRSKKYGWGKAARGSSYLSCVAFAGRRGKVVEDSFSWASRMWRKVFFSNLCIRSYCHTCPYASIEKPADITVGDFWGIEKVAPNFDDGKGCSVALVRTMKGQEILDETVWISKMEVTLDDSIAKQANAFSPSEADPAREQFWKDYKAKGFPYVAKTYFGYTATARTKAFIKRILFAFHLKDIY